MARSQNTPRESLAAKQLELTTDGTAVLSTNSTGNLLLSKGLALSGESADAITQNSTALFLAGGLAISGESTDIITQDSTAVKMSAGLSLSGQGSANAITQNSTAVTFPDGSQVASLSAVLSGRKGPATIVFVGNSTGNMLAVNTTGTTWKYLNVTSVLA